ncbi:PXA domain-containing protein [Loa loa]|uniref:PXA domain-containing protein n=1 Tax=Loa loa TaxID=7209 RepID=A0A1S0ULJ8_LOALO|nr:PXA domain-containing protein [Loa loa]EJD76443.1 PXA domain-containing protein [Loa loa]
MSLIDSTFRRSVSQHASIVVGQAAFVRVASVMRKGSKQIAMSSMFYLLLGTVLFLTSFGISGLCIFLSLLLGLILGLFMATLKRGLEISDKDLCELDEITKKFRFISGRQGYLENRGRFSENAYEQEQPMTNSVTIDAILEQMLSYVIRDFIDLWYSSLTPDHHFKESLKRSARRTVAAFSQCVQKVDFVPLLTQHIVDDIASHFRLFRRAKERAQLHYGKNYTTDELETMFFDLELEMEKCYCRDLVSTCPHYENAYFHDVADILLYLLTPAEDFRSRPFRFLVREIYIKRMMLPLFDMLSDPDFINHSIIWLLSETSLKSEDFIATLETTDSMKELDAVLDSLREEAAHLRTKDSGGEQGFLVKQQLASIDYAINIIKRRMDALETFEVENDLREVATKIPLGNSSIVQLPIHVVLSNNTAVTYFADFLASVGGQALIDCYLAVEGFKISVEHQLRGLAVGETLESDAYETVKEAASFLYQQYISQEAVTRVSLDDVTVKRLLMRIRNDDPPDVWFEQVQAKIVDILQTDERFYDSFKKSSIYIKMLNELGLNEDINCQIANSQYNDENNIKSVIIPTSETKIANNVDGLKRTQVGMHAVVETLGIGQQGKQSFALYNVRVSRIDATGKQSSTWNVLRRYSDFHTLNSLIQSRFPKLSNLCFPGKKTFNNLNSRFLEKRTKALNSYMMSILQPSVLEANADLETLIFDFLSMKDYIGEREGFPKKVMSAVFEPLKSGVRAFGNAVTAMPDTVYDGVTRVGDGINKAAKQIIDFQPTQGFNGLSNKKDDLSRVAAVYNDQQWIESIPLRVLVLLIGEVFGVRSRNAWFRRRLVAVLNQFVHATMGSSLNRKIIDIVQWLTSKQQVAQYLVAFRNTLWPDGKLAEGIKRRPEGERLRTSVLARAQMLSALPDELRLFIGAETTNRGIANVSEAFQNCRLNRRLLYVIFERLLANFFPDNHFEKIFPQLHARSPRSKPFHV